MTVTQKCSMRFGEGVTTYDSVKNKNAQVKHKHTRDKKFWDPKVIFFRQTGFRERIHRKSHFLYSICPAPN